MKFYYNCNFLGHIARNFDRPPRKDRCSTQCYNCENLGQLNKDCWTPTAETQNPLGATKRGEDDNQKCKRLKLDPNEQYPTLYPKSKRGQIKICFSYQMPEHFAKGCVAPKRTTRQVTQCYHYGKMGYICKYEYAVEYF